MLHLYRQHSHSLVPCSSTIITVSRWVLVATSSSNYQIFSYYASQQYDIINQWKCVQELRRFLLQQTKDSIQCNMSNGYFFKKVVAEQLLTFLQGPYFSGHCWSKWASIFFRSNMQHFCLHFWRGKYIKLSAI